MTPPPPAPVRPDSIPNVRALVRLLDSAVRVPGTPIRLGLDAVIGLIPGVGDVAGAALSGVVVVVAARQGVGPAVLLRMLVNVAVDMLTGAVPVLGDLFDVGWRANTRNLALLDRALADPAATRRSSAVVVVLVLAVLLAVLAAGVSLAVWVAGAVVDLIR